jgi:hypothetical protein
VPNFLHNCAAFSAQDGTDFEAGESRGLYEALGFGFERDTDIVRNGELEATNYFFGIGDQESVTTTAARTTSAPATGTSPSPRTISSRRSRS